MKFWQNANRGATAAAKSSTHPHTNKQVDGTSASADDTKKNAP